MRDQILYFMNLNPWSTFFTVLMFAEILIMLFESIIAKEFSRAFVFALFITIICFLYNFLGITTIADWIDKNHGNGDEGFMYFLCLCGLSSMAYGLYRYQRKKDDDDGPLVIGG